MASQWGWLKRFRSDAEGYLLEGRVLRIDFSGATYQVEVVDRDTEVHEWPFFQFDEKANLSDAFCSCEAEDGCIHQAAALLKIYDGKEEPLHIRFQRSFWKALCQILADHSGYDGTRIVKEKKGHYSFRNEIRFHLHAKTGAKGQTLERMLGSKPKETPENSLKFSNLSQEEIQRWRMGRPSQKLRFELSFWADLAKEWMTRQEEGNSYKITFTDSPEGFPTSIKIEWKDLVLECALLIEDLPALIPTLSTVESSLTVGWETEKSIQSIQYDAEKKEFHIQHRIKKLKKDTKERLKIDGWSYVVGEGFYAYGDETLLDRSIIPQEEIDQFLDLHARDIAPIIEGTTLHIEPRALSYEMFFDSDWNWHFKAYLLKKRDLDSPLSTLFGKWAYIDGEGFFSVEGVLFPSVEKVLSSKEVSHFVNHHRIWLNMQEGFATHLASIETHLAYIVTSEGILRFYGRLHTQEGSIETRDFGDWIYFEKLGFFSKKYARIGLGVRPGIEIAPSAISAFIKDYREELEAIPHFFYPVMPLLTRGLKITSLGSSEIEITPEWQVLSEYSHDNIRFFDEFLYIDGKGFCELPPKMRLPEGYEERSVIREDEVSHFIEEEFDKIKHFVTHIDEELRKPHKCALQVDYLVRHPEGGLKAALFYVTEFGKISVTLLQEALLKKRKYLFSEAGCFDLREDRFQWLKRLKIPSQPALKIIELSTLDFLRLDVTEGILGPTEMTPTSSITQALLKELREFNVADRPFPKDLKSELRLYQQTGLSWLWFLYRNGLSGLLCDEMGLGKTHQAMALIASCLAVKEKRERRFLVVCPTSVIYHWQDKLEAFLPSLAVHTFHGFRRSLEGLPKECVLLTSYGILRSEKEVLKNIPFEIVIFDEIQNAKNPHSRIHHALLSIQARMRVGLTGTPIENSLRELKALFDVVLPGYMPSEAAYKEFFINPIEKEENEERKALLSQLIRPFVLRRRKREVLQELPEKSEDKSYCELSEEQIRLYQESLAKTGQSLVRELRKGEAPIPYVHIFSVLSQLKQICNHPALILKEPSHYKKYASGKWDLFVELLEEARESQQKVVVFSQFLQMLDIIELYLQEKGWKYAQIRGSTLDRREQLKRFQEDPNCVVFLGSLQAAGVGIDLTAANVVILYDRWWNAARENQAIDRVHRIGQKWGVQVYKLITKRTVEEKIDKMITKKGQLMEEVILADDQAQLKHFSRTELIELLTFEPEE